MNILKKRENVPPLHCDGVPYVTLVNADEDIMFMLLVIMLSFYFCEICGNFPQTVTNHTCPLCTGTQWSTISATRIIRCQVSFISSTHTPILVHCCTLSLCHLGSEIGWSSQKSKYQYRDHLVGYPKLKNNWVSFSLTFNIEWPFQRYLLKTVLYRGRTNHSVLLIITYWS